MGRRARGRAGVSAGLVIFAAGQRAPSVWHRHRRARERIYSYTLSFPDGTLLDEAKRQVLQEFPPDARFGVEDADEPRCLLADVRSPAVEAVMDGDRPLVGFFSEETADTEDFDPRDVDYAIFTLAAPDESVDLGMC